MPRYPFEHNTQYRAIIKTKSIISHTVTPEKLLSVQVHFSVQNSEELVRFSNWSCRACKGCRIRAVYCQTPVLGLGLGVDFTFAGDNHNNHKNDKNDKNDNSPRLRERNSTRG